MQKSDVRINRILTIYSKLIWGNQVNKKELAKLFQVDEKTIQRDLVQIRRYLESTYNILDGNKIVYTRGKKSYVLEK